MIFEGKNIAEVRIGICPVCDKNAEVIDKCKNMHKQTICSNEYYHHFSADGIDYIYKRKNTKNIFQT